MGRLVSLGVIATILHILLDETHRSKNNIKLKSLLSKKEKDLDLDLGLFIAHNDFAANRACTQTSNSEIQAKAAADRWRLVLGVWLGFIYRVTGLSCPPL